jgi:hypothetical protein
MAPFAFIAHHGHHMIQEEGLDRPRTVDCMKKIAIDIKGQLEREGVLTFVDEPDLPAGADARQLLLDRLFECEVTLGEHTCRTCQHVVAAPTAIADFPHQQQPGPHSLPKLIKSYYYIMIINSNSPFAPVVAELPAQHIVAIRLSKHRHALLCRPSNSDLLQFHCPTVFPPGGCCDVL